MRTKKMARRKRAIRNQGTTMAMKTIDIVTTSIF
jgi:hypothetical protein